MTLAIMAGSKLGSSYFQGKASKAIKKRRGEITDRTQAELKKFRKNAAESFQKSLKAASPDEITAASAEAAAERELAYTENIKQDVLLPGATGGSEAAQRAIIKSLGEAVTGSKETAQRRSAVDAYNDALFGRDVTLGQSAQNIAQKGSFAAGREGVAELEYLAAPSAGRKYANIAGMISAAGQLAAGAAGSGWFGASGPTSEQLLAFGQPTPKFQAFKL